MPFPATFAALKAAGYKFENHGKCRGCGREIEWWGTPKGKRMPFNLMVDGEFSKAVSHFGTCPDAESFRK